MRVFQSVKEILCIDFVFPTGVSFRFTADIGVSFDSSGGWASGFFLTAACGDTGVSKVVDFVGSRCNLGVLSEERMDV